MLIDTHAHLNFNAYKVDVLEVIRRSLENNTWMINVGSQYKTSERAVELAESYEKGVYAAVGLHPIHLSKGIFKTKIDTEEIEFETQEEMFDYTRYRDLAKSPKVIAIGETGLDYYYRPKTKIKLEQFKERQRTVLCLQLELAKELNLPVIFHCRMAHQDLIDILNSKFHWAPSGELSEGLPPDPTIRGVVHCFTGNEEQAQKYLDMGFYLGFNGLIFKPAPYRTEGSGLGMNFDEIIEKTPLGKILIETDCPYLTPLPMSGRNEPIYVKYVAEKIAKIKKMSYTEIANITTQNARELFKI